MHSEPLNYTDNNTFGKSSIASHSKNLPVFGIHQSKGNSNNKMIISPNHKTHIMGKDSPGVGRYDAHKVKIVKPN